MNKLFTKIAGVFLGLAMAVGVGVAASSSSEAVPVSASTATPQEGYEWATMTEGTNGSTAQVNYNSNVSHSAIKVGTSSKGGDCTIKIPLGTTSLKFYAYAWKGVSNLKLNLSLATGSVNAKMSNDSIALDSNTGISNSSPFTFSGNPALTEVQFSGVTSDTTLKLTTSIAKRFVIWDAQISKAAPKTLESISIKTPPTKTTYYAGDKFDPTGLVVTKYFDDGFTEDLPYSGNINLFTFNPKLEAELKETDTKVVITVSDKTASQSIIVKQIRTLTIASGLETVKKAYEEGNSFDPTGLKVTAAYSDGSTEDVSSSVVWKPSTLLQTTTSVTGTYKGLTVSVDGIVVSPKTFVNTFNIENNGRYTISHTKDGVVYYLVSNGTTDLPSISREESKATVFTFVLIGNDTFQVKTDESNYLYTTDSNKGLRVGSTEDAWVISQGTKGKNGSYEFKDIKFNRYLSLFETTDFRTYDSPSGINRTENTDLNKAPVPASFKITGIPESNLKIGDSGMLSIDDETLNVSWTSSDESIVSIADGMYFAEAGGVATITATDSSTGSKATAIIVVDFGEISISEANRLASSLAVSEVSQYKITLKDTYITQKVNTQKIVLSDNTAESTNSNSIMMFDYTKLADLSNDSIINGRVTVTGNLQNFKGTIQLTNPELIAYTDTAIRYANDFYVAFTATAGEKSAICADPNRDNSAEIIEMWDTVAGLYDMLDEYAKAKLKGATSSDSNPTIANMVALYDHIVKRYSATHTEINDFIGRGVTASLTNQLFKVNTTNNIMVISLIACASAAAIGSFFFIRKRKEQN